MESNVLKTLSFYSKWNCDKHINKFIQGFSYEWTEVRSKQFLKIKNVQNLEHDGEKKEFI